MFSNDDGFPICADTLTVQEKMKRTKRWEDLLAQSSGVLPDKSQSLKKCIRQGVPSSIRGKVWFKYSGAGQAMLINPMRFRHCLKNAKDLNNWDWCHSFENLIKENIVENVKFNPIVSTDTKDGTMQSQPSRNIKRLKRVIMTYFIEKAVAHDEYYSLGYVIKIASMLILHLQDDEAVFWMLVSMPVPDIADHKAILLLISERMPRFSTISFESQSAPDALKLTSEWFSDLFIGHLSTECTLWILDCYWYEGVKILYRVALSIAHLHNSHLNASMDLSHILKHAIYAAPSAHKLFEVMFSKYTGPCTSLSEKLINEKRDSVSNLFNHRENVCKVGNNSKDVELVIPPSLHLSRNSSSSLTTVLSSLMSSPENGILKKEFDFYQFAPTYELSRGSNISSGFFD